MAGRRTSLLFLLAIGTFSLSATVTDANQAVSGDALYNLEFSVIYRVIDGTDIMREISVRFVALRDVYFENLHLVFEINGTLSMAKPPYGEDSLGNRHDVYFKEFLEGSDRRVAIRTVVYTLKLKTGDHYSLRILNILEEKGAKRLGTYGFSEYLVFPKILGAADEKILFYLKIPRQEHLLYSFCNPYSHVRFVRLDPSFETAEFESDVVTLIMRPSSELLGPKRKLLFEVIYEYVLDWPGLVLDVAKSVTAIVAGAILHRIWQTFAQKRKSRARAVVV